MDYICQTPLEKNVYSSNFFSYKKQHTRTVKALGALRLRPSGDICLGRCSIVNDVGWMGTASLITMKPTAPLNGQHSPLCTEG